MRRRCLGLAGRVGLVAALGLWPIALDAAVARADGGESAADGSSRAVELYAEGRDLLRAGRAADALPKLVDSLGLLASPNTELLIAHARREIGLRVEAQETYERVQRAAAAEVARGQSRYLDTEQEATRWLNELSASLGRVSVEAPAEATVEVARGGSKAPATFRGSGSAWSEPGDVTVTMRGKDQEQRRTVRVGPGTTVRLDFTSPAVTEPPPEPPPPPDGGPVVSVPGVVLLGVGLAGVGMFAGFAVSARSKLDELEACTPACPESKRDVHDTGKRDQLIANVSIGVGAAALAAGATIWIVEAVLDAEPAPAAKAGVSLRGIGLGVSTREPELAPGVTATWAL